MDLAAGPRTTAGRHGRPETAALLLAAANHAASPPSLTGDDAAEDSALIRSLRERIGEPVHERITALAAVLPRANVFDRGRAAIDDLRASRARKAADGGAVVPP